MKQEARAFVRVFSFNFAIRLHDFGFFRRILYDIFSCPMKIIDPVC